MVTAFTQINVFPERNSYTRRMAASTSGPEVIRDGLRARAAGRHVPTESRMRCAAARSPRFLGPDPAAAGVTPASSVVPPTPSSSVPSPAARAAAASRRGHQAVLRDIAAGRVTSACALPMPDLLVQSP
eukprot:TRINITY_DN29733_c0_g1_i1.p4 TRINITY_DN29733_c0_g1~~TRINITY_DN29733_c0_g1_i1.p4  ORF type:complete len:129 (+),score=21.57 TRINITY_DN29733_c0_g1_i1:463-849(+)